MKLIPLTRGAFAMVDDEDFEELNKFKWNLGTNGYANRGCWNKETQKRSIILMHRQIMGSPEGMLIDHKDEIKLNNQRYNLRKSNKKQNGMNRGANKNNTTGYKGVFRNTHPNTFMARIMVDKKPIYLGCRQTAMEAAMLYNDAAIRYQGEFAKLNPILLTLQTEV